MTTDKTGAPTEVTEEADRFSISVDGDKAGFTEYVDRGNQRVFPHTEIDDAFGGRGLATILVGDAPYYGRFGFSDRKTGQLTLPGPFERDRLLGLELRDGALDGAWGMVVPSGPAAPQRKPRVSAKLPKLAPRAA